MPVVDERIGPPRIRIAENGDRIGGRDGGFLLASRRAFETKPLHRVDERPPPGALLFVIVAIVAAEEERGPAHFADAEWLVLDRVDLPAPASADSAPNGSLGFPFAAQQESEILPAIGGFGFGAELAPHVEPHLALVRRREAEGRPEQDREPDHPVVAATGLQDQRGLELARLEAASRGREIGEAGRLLADLEQAGIVA